MEDQIVFLNGDFVKWEKAKIHLMSHSLGRGSAIFEVLSFHNIKRGPAVFRIDRHIDRFFRSADLLNMEIAMSKQDLQNCILKTIQQNRLKQGFIKLIGFYPQITFEILPPEKKINISIFVIDAEKYLSDLSLSFQKGTTLCISKWRKLDPQSVPVEAKVAANYLNGIMAQFEGKDRGFEHAVMLSNQGFIAEGGTESIFWVTSGVVKTPSTGTVLKSITRESIIEAAGFLGLKIEEGTFTQDALYEADEIFLSSTTFKIWPVQKFEDRSLNIVPGPVTSKLFSLMDEITMDRNKSFSKWFFPVA